MTYAFQNPSADVLKAYLESAKTIAVVGLSDRQDTAAYGVAKFMQAMGYRIVPVNPKLAGQAKVFWAQLGLESQEAETILRSAGKKAIVMNRCLKIDYLKWIANQS
ncbi:UNVERIFIED_CONTAM: CoA-binding protein [Streptococcus canis]